MNASGINAINIDRVRRVGDRLREELNSRKQRLGEHYSIEPAASVFDSGESTTTEVVTQGWTEQRLAELISDGIEENFQLEYKAAASLQKQNRERAEITKDVSAFANSAGGTLIYGIAEYGDANRCHLPERLDPVSRSAFSREWLEQVIGSIRPRILNLRITAVPLSDSPDSVAYVVEIPQGSTAHQAADFRYYRRYNFESVAMLDHEVRDVMNRRGQPRLRIAAELVFFRGARQDRADGNLIFHIHNDSDVFVRYVGLIAETPLRFRGKLVAFENATIIRGSVSGWRLGYSNHSGAPLFPRAYLTRHFTFRLIDRFTNPLPPNEISDVRYIAYADNNPPLQGRISASTLESGD